MDCPVVIGYSMTLDFSGVVPILLCSDKVGNDPKGYVPIDSDGKYDPVITLTMCEAMYPIGTRLSRFRFNEVDSKLRVLIRRED